MICPNVKVIAASRPLTDKRYRLIAPYPASHFLSIIPVPPAARKHRPPAPLRRDLHIRRPTPVRHFLAATLHLAEHLLVQREGEGVIVSPFLVWGREELEEEAQEETLPCPWWAGDEYALVASAQLPVETRYSA